MSHWDEDQRLSTNYSMPVVVLFFSLPGLLLCLITLILMAVVMIGGLYV